MRRRDLDELTDREREVLALLRRDFTNEQIAQRLGISLDGAKYHVSQILSKLGVATREEAAAVAIGERRRWWAHCPSWAKVAGAATVVAAVTGLGLLTWGVLRTGGPTSTPQQPTHSSAIAASPGDDRPRVYRMLVANEDLPVEFEITSEPHSVVGVEQGSGPPNARVMYELPAQPEDLSKISCLTSSVSELKNEAEAMDALESTRQRYRRQTGNEGQSVEEVAVPKTGDGSAGSTLLSEISQIGSCGTRPVYAYAEMTFRRGSVIAVITGFTPKERPNPELIFDVAQTQLARIDQVLSAP